MMDKVLYTAGYGSDAPEAFLKRLTDAGVTVVLDVRRKGSKSWCLRYNQGRACGMEMLLFEANIGYREWWEFGNRFDELSAYLEWLDVVMEGKYIEGRARVIEKNTGLVFCLLCSERDAYKDGKDGEVNCHRVYVADARVKGLGDGWSVEHI